jgi:hypothetical protein
MNTASLLPVSPQSDKMATGMRDEAEKAASIIANGGSQYHDWKKRYPFATREVYMSESGMSTVQRQRKWR